MRFNSPLKKERETRFENREWVRRGKMQGRAVHGDRAEGRHVLLVLENLSKKERFFGRIASEGAEAHIAMYEARNELDVVLDAALV